MPRPPARQLRTLALAATATVALTACGAGSRTAAETATEVACDVEVPAEPTTVNVLAYNSSAIDPFTNTMVSSCTQGELTVEHEPIDFAGQVQRTTATLSGETGTYDIIETYGYIIPELVDEQSIRPLGDLYERYSEEYGLEELDESMREVMSFEGELYAVPMQAQMFLMAYRSDVFEELGLQPPTTFAELKEVSAAIQESGQFEYPLALPWLASSDIGTAYDATLGSLGVDFVDPEARTANFDTPEALQALEELVALTPYMDPQVTTFDQPAVQQQMYNGDAAMSIMFSGRMNDLTLEANSQYAADFAFAPSPSVGEDGPYYSALSVDGWSIPVNTQLDEDLLFEIMASSVSEEASTSAVPAAYPARAGAVSDDSGPYAAAANDAITNAPPAEPYPWTARISTAITPVVASVVLGQTAPADGQAQMQQIATDILAEYQE